MNGVTWLILGLIVVLLGWVVIEWRRQQRTAVPEVVRAVRARHAAEPDEPEQDPDEEPAAAEPVDEPQPVNDGRGATVTWSPLAEVQSVGEGRLLAAGVPDVSIDEVDDWAIWEAEFQADLRRCDNALEDARRLCTANLVAAGLPLAVMQAIDLRDAVSHERAVDRATVLTTTEIRLPATSTRPHKPTPARARRDRKRANRALGGAQ